jgi:hypothetical protein
VLLAGFLEFERRGRTPLMRLSIFRLHGLAAADLTLLLTAAAVFATFFSDLAARAIGCAQCAPVAVTITSARETGTSADDPTPALHR